MLPSKCRHYLECNNPVLPTLVQSYIWVCADLWLDQRCSDIKALSSRGWGLGTGCDRGFGKGRELRGESVRQGLKRVRWKDGAFVSGLWTTHYGWVVNPHFLSQKSLNERSKWYAIKKTKSWVEWPFFSVLFPFLYIFCWEMLQNERDVLPLTAVSTFNLWSYFSIFPAGEVRPIHIIPAAHRMDKCLLCFEFWDKW